jgi:hypothetical protein
VSFSPAQPGFASEARRWDIHLCAFLLQRSMALSTLGLHPKMILTIFGE